MGALDERAFEAAASHPDRAQTHVAIGEIVDHSGEAGFGLVVALLALVAIPFFGLSTPFGLAIVLCGVQMAVGKRRPWLPGVLRRQQLSLAMLDRVAGMLARRTAWLGRITRRIEALVDAGAPLTLDDMASIQADTHSNADADTAERDDALDADSLRAARHLRQAITDDGDIDGAFDDITYEKGAAVLHMFERWIGADVMQRAVRAYLARHAYGTATAADFLAAASEASGKDVTAAMGTFLDQGGAPEVELTTTCDAEGTVAIDLAQRRYQPLDGAAATDDPPQRWQVPVCVAYGDASTRHDVCTLVVDGQASLVLPAGVACPRWAYANVGGVGYYRVAGGAALEATLAHGWAQLTPAERLTLVQDLRAQVARGRLDVAVLLRALPGLVASGTEAALDEVADVVRDLKPQLTPTAALRRWDARRHASGDHPARGAQAVPRVQRVRAARAGHGAGAGPLRWRSRRPADAAGRVRRGWLARGRVCVRGVRRGDPPPRQPRGGARRAPPRPAGPGLPDGRHPPRAPRRRRGLPQRPRDHPGPRPRGDRSLDTGGPRVDRRHRAPLPGQQGAAHRADRRPRELSLIHI